MFKWVQGRQHSGYWKCRLLYSKFFRFDLYLLKFEAGVRVPWHKDPVKNGGRHFRLNIYLSNPGGGKLLLEEGKKAIFSNRLFHFFRPDEIEHAMTQVEGGTLYMLSIGKVIK